MQASNDDYDLEEIMEQLKPDALLLQTRPQPVVDTAVLAAARRIMTAAGDKKMMQKEWQIPTHVKTAIEKSVRQHLHDGFLVIEEDRAREPSGSEDRFPELDFVTFEDQGLESNPVQTTELLDVTIEPPRTVRAHDQ